MSECKAFSDSRERRMLTLQFISSCFPDHKEIYTIAHLHFNARLFLRILSVSQLLLSLLFNSLCNCCIYASSFTQRQSGKDLANISSTHTRCRAELLESSAVSLVSKTTTVTRRREKLQKSLCYKLFLVTNLGK